MVQEWANGPPKCGSVPNAERRKGAILGQGAQTGFPVDRCCCCAEDKPCYRGKEVCVSNVIYQDVYLIRLINVSAFLSN